MLTATGRSVLINIENWVKEKFAQGPSSHSWNHTRRVFDNAIIICRAEGGDEFLVSLAALFHDLGRVPETKNETYCYTGHPVKLCRHRKHAVLSVYEANEKIGELKKTGILNNEQRRELRYIIHTHGDLLSGSARETKNLKILKDADMVDGFGINGILRNFSHSKRDKMPLWAPGLTIDFPETRPLTIPEGDESGLGNLQFVYNFQTLLVFESSRELAEPQLALNRDILYLLRQEIHNGGIPNYEFWIQFVTWAQEKNLKRLLSSDLKDFQDSVL